tara:strand:- start:308 stop:952 length:645 start_codon:yes stop_codon:yes gene_type:complete
MKRERSYNKTKRLVIFGARFSVLLFVFFSPLKTNAAQAPDAVIREVFDELLIQLDSKRQSNSLTDENVRSIFATLLSPRIDYLALAQWILRDHWVNASVEQKNEFLNAFEQYIINTYALALSKGEKIVLDVKENPLLRKNTAVVTAGIKIANADAIPLDFRLIQRGEKWLLFDVTFSGVSLALTFRSDFSYVAKNGGIDAVTSHLNHRRKSSSP